MITEHAPKFSVVVPAYQAAETLSATLDAILAQSFGDWECVVVDDGSSDETLAIARHYATRTDRIRALHQENQGSGGAYNSGVGASRGDYIVICSADDILLPDHLATIAAFIDASSTDFDIISSNGYFWYPSGERALVYVDATHSRSHTLELDDVIRVCFYGVGAAFKRDVFSLVGGFRLDIYGEDYDFWLRAIALGARHRYIPAALSLFRISASQKSARAEAVYRSDIRIVSELRRDFRLSPAQERAVDECIRERERLIRELYRTPLRLRIRTALRAAAMGLLGRERARRWWVTVRRLPRGRDATLQIEPGGSWTETARGRGRGASR